MWITAISFCCLTAMQHRRSGGPAAGGVLDGLHFAWRDPYLRAMTAFSLYSWSVPSGFPRQRPASSWPASALVTSGVRAALWILTALYAASGLTLLLTPLRHLRDLPRRPPEDSVPPMHLEV
jgi:hypothetical protein